MKILQVCNRVPYPARDGGTLAMNNLAEALINQGHQVKMAALNTRKHYIGKDSIPEEYRRKTNIQTFDIDTSVNPADALLYLFKKGSYNIGRFYSPGFEQMLVSILEKEDFDIVQLESLFVVPYIPSIRRYSKAKIVLRSHNVEYRLWEQKALAETSFFRKLYLCHLEKRIRQYEVENLNRYDAIVAITAEDAETFRSLGCRKPLHITPFGIDTREYSFPGETPKSPASICFIGSFDWQPNLDGIYWFLEHCWPSLSRDLPDLKLRIAGKNMPASLENLQVKNVEIRGEVKSSPEFISENTLMIVPLFAGSGMRIKIIEGMALGKPIVSTSLGAEGIHCTPGKDILLADTPEQFSNLIQKCILEEDLADIGKNARKLVESEYDNTALASSLIGFYKNLIAE